MELSQESSILIIFFSERSLSRWHPDILDLRRFAQELVTFALLGSIHFRQLP
jgi:hypothetical protein